MVYKNCQASGVPVGFTQLGKAIQTTVGGNPNLEPEDAETLTIGAVWMPTFVNDLTLTLDYFNIKIDNAIQGIPGSTKLAVCYTGKITGGRGSYAQWRSFSSLTLEEGPWSGSYSIQYIGSAEDINASKGDIGDHAPSVSYHNVQAKYSFNKALDVVFGVDNLWDKKAPFIQSYTDANTDTMTYDLLGRRWNAKLTYRW